MNSNQEEYIDSLIERIRYLENLNDDLRKKIRILQKKTPNQIHFDRNYYHGMIETDKDSLC